MGYFGTMGPSTSQTVHVTLSAAKGIIAAMAPFAALRVTLYALACLPTSISAQTGAPAGPVPVERLEARRSALMEGMGAGVAVIRSARARSLEVDHPQDSDYRENNDFFYLTGLEAPGAALVLVARRGRPIPPSSTCRNGRRPRSAGPAAA